MALGRRMASRWGRAFFAGSWTGSGGGSRRSRARVEGGATVPRAQRFRGSGAGARPLAGDSCSRAGSWDPEAG